MKTIGIVGMGKMGQSIASLLETYPHLRAHTFSRLSAENHALLKQCDVVIEFTTSEVAAGVIRQCLEQNIPVVSGTTGWHEYHLGSILSLCKQRHSTFLYATNFSLGMNIMFALNKKLASIMSSFPQFKPSIKEVHHVHKKDSPSGTAYTLMEGILQLHPKYTGFALNAKSEVENKLPVTSVREGEVKGFHEVTWNSGTEVLTIAHDALDRKIFAEGAIMAAQWLIQQPPGIYTMQDIIHV